MGESEGLLSLDPAVIFLQIVAFIVLFALLRSFLFGPLMAVMHEREQEINEGLEAGDRARAELAQIDQERERVLGVAREEGRNMVRSAVKEGEEARDRIVTEAREEAQDLRRRGRESLDLERQEVMLQLRREVVDLALLAAQRAVLAPLDEEHHRRAIDEFIGELERKP